MTETVSPLGPTLHLVVSRHDGRPVRAGWGVLQQIKNDTLGDQVCAIEVFPAQADVVDEINYRHFWSVPTGVSPCLLGRRGGVRRGTGPSGPGLPVALPGLPGRSDIVARRHGQ